MTAVYRQTSRDATEIRYADQAARGNTAAVKVVVQPKKAGSETVYNVNSSINLQRTATLPEKPGCADKCTLNQEKLSLRFSTSGSTASSAEIDKMCDDFLLWFPQFREDMKAGFLTEIATLNTAV